VSSRRRERVQSLLQETISEIVIQELADPRMGFLTVTKVQVSPDLREAKVFVSIIGNEEGIEDKTFDGLRDAAGYVQRRVAETIELRNTPRLRFVLDDSVKKSVRISALLRRISEERGDEPDET
jgi:ribosome-binding factor A